MNNLVLNLFQVILASGILFGYYWIALRNKRFHHYNRFYLLAATGLSLIVPFLNIPLYFSNAEADSSFILRNLANSPDPGEVFSNDLPATPLPLPAESWFTLPHILLIVYILVGLLILGRVLFSLLSIKKIIRKYPAEQIGNIRFVNTEEPGTPFSFFRWLFWDRKIELRSSKGEQIFRHEMYHINEKHSSDTVFMEIVNVIFWINPFFYLIRKELRVIHEFLADQFAVKEHNEYDYAELLLMQVLGTENRLTQPFFNNQIKRRILMLTNSSKSRHQYLRKIMLLPMAAVLTVLFAFSYHRKDEPATATPVVVVIDAGHGGSETGVMSGNVKESDLNLQLAKMVQSLNDDPSIQVILTRKGDETLTAQERTNLSIQMRADLFISLHINSAGILKNAQGTKQENKQGIEVYGASRNLTSNSRLLASALINSLNQVYTTAPDIKQRKEGIYVLDWNPAPAVIVECGYINNPADLAFISKTENQQLIAKSILSAIREFSLRRVTELRVYNDTDKPYVRIIGKYPEPKKPTDEQLKAWLDPKTYGVWIDNKKIANSQLTKYKAADFANHYVSKLYKNALHHNEYAYQVDLYTNTWFSKNGKKGQYPDTLMWMRSKVVEEPKSKALVVVDGKVIGYLNDMKKLDDMVNTNDLESVTILKGDDAIKKYGDKGKDGVIEIITKEKKTGVKDPGMINKVVEEPENKLFTKVEEEASFPGGQDKWNLYLDKVLDKQVPVKQGAPEGHYTVVIQFVVDIEGNISDVRPLTNMGYGMEEEAMRVIKKGPKWISAIQNGHAVKAYKKQKVDFHVTSEVAQHQSDSDTKTKIQTIPVLTLEELKKSTPFSLCGVKPGTEIVSYVFTIDKPDHSIVEVFNTGSTFSDATKMQIEAATSGKLLTIDQIRVKIDGEVKKLVSKIYTLQN